MNPRRQLAAGALLTLGWTLCVSCRTASPAPPADFSAPGWTVRQGQAVWKPPGRRPELAGDLLLATNANGNAVIQFSKSPFTLAAAQVIDGSWRIEFGDGRRHWTGRGTPSKHFLWFQLPRALAGVEPAPPWKFSRHGDSWRLENPRTGESLEGFLSP